MNEPHSWFREESERKRSDLEALSAPVMSKGRIKVYRCSLLGQECSYSPKVGTGDCRSCNFALAYLMAHPEYVKEKIDARK